MFLIGLHFKYIRPLNSGLKWTLTLLANCRWSTTTLTEQQKSLACTTSFVLHDAAKFHWIRQLLCAINTHAHTHSPYRRAEHCNPNSGCHVSFRQGRLHVRAFHLNGGGIHHQKWAPCMSESVSHNLMMDTVRLLMHSIGAVIEKHTFSQSY